HDALRDFITGSGVERVKLELMFNGKTVTAEFLEALREHDYHPTTVGEIEVQPGERVPAFVIQGSTAFFGWVFWEKFTEKKMRKLWGSVLRNTKGDWAIQIPPTKPTTIYANSSHRLLMDLDKPF
ncbi:MAG TPA: hypothetical protein VNN76_07095, partial [Bacteroidota bacterium]|nr:hypothetical protein [Bacteroidota bacterium]